jgi:starch phosphorylase
VQSAPPAASDNANPRTPADAAPNPHMNRDSPLSADLDRQLLHHVGVAPACASPAELMNGVAHLARERLSQRWVAAQSAQRGSRRVCYLSMEFLMGRTLGNALAALDLAGDVGAALHRRAQQLEDIEQHEADAALGNGGLGRLAACFLDSMATLGLPSIGYGIRYEYGMFAQSIVDGRQVEHPDPWLGDGSPWEFPRLGVHYPVRFGGFVEHRGDLAIWHPVRANLRVLPLVLCTSFAETRSLQLEEYWAQLEALIF